MCAAVWACVCVVGMVLGRVMTPQRWVFLHKLAAPFPSSPSSRSCRTLHVLSFSQSAAVNMAEEAKRQAAYVAVDNNVQVQWTSVSLLANKLVWFAERTAATRCSLLA